MRRVLGILLLAALAGCAATPPATTPPAEPARRTLVGPDHVTLADQDALIELKQGARIHVRLESERISKNRWHIESMEGAAIAPHGNPWMPTMQPYAVRLPANLIFDFDAVAPGKTTVTFGYRRDDEPASAAERKATFAFLVR